MKRSAIKAGKLLQRRTPLKNHGTRLKTSKPLKAVGFSYSKTTTTPNAVDEQSHIHAPAAPKPTKRGLKGIAPTKKEREFHDRLAALGCIACRLDGTPSPPVSIHHCDGRTKKGCHMNVLPLCAGHHQDGTGLPNLIARHPWKARFEERYGREADLLTLCLRLIAVEDGIEHGGVP